MTVVRTVRANLVSAVNRLDASFHASPGEAAAARVIASGRPLARIGDLGDVWTPSRFARAWAAPGEPGVPYLRPYDTLDYLPVPADFLSTARTDNLDALRIALDDILVTCSGRNLGPPVAADHHLTAFALSHDMVRLRVSEPSLRWWLYAYLRSRTGQSLLRRGKAGSVIDHITVDDVRRVPVPLPDDGSMTEVAALVERAVRQREAARSGLVEALSVLAGDAWQPGREEVRRREWTMRAAALEDRLDAGHYHPAVTAAAAQAAEQDGPRIGDLARGVLPVRYRRVYVGPEHGRPILSGRQLLQADPVNLRYVADRSFRDPDAYTVREGAVIFGAAGRSGGRIGQPALVRADRDGWLASNDVMRLFPHDTTHSGALWLAIALPQTQVQIKGLSYGSVIDHMNPWDVEALRVPPVPRDIADRALTAWVDFAASSEALRSASDHIEQGIADAAAALD